MYIIRTYPGWLMHGVYLDVTYKVSLTSKYNYHLHKTIPLREHFLTVKETVKDNVPVDTGSVIHKLLVLLVAAILMVHMKCIQSV